MSDTSLFLYYSSVQGCTQGPLPPSQLSRIFTQCSCTLLCLGVSPSSPVSHEVPEEAVLSPVSNHVFERRLVVQYIEENGTDPINGEPLSVDQLLEIKGEETASDTDICRGVEQVYLQVNN